jgi:hypothetical protein
MQIWESNGRNYLEIVGVTQTVEVQRLTWLNL